MQNAKHFSRKCLRHLVTNHSSVLDIQKRALVALQSVCSTQNTACTTDFLWLGRNGLERLLLEMSWNNNMRLWVVHGISWKIWLQVSAISGGCIYHTNWYQKRTPSFKCFQNCCWWLQKAALVLKGLKAFYPKSSVPCIRLDEYLDNDTGSLEQEKFYFYICCREKKNNKKLMDCCTWCNIIQYLYEK